MIATTAGGAIPLSVGDLAIAAALVVIAGAVSVLLRLQLERRLALASVRTVVQLVLVGYVLRFVFETDALWTIAIVVLIMIVAASVAAVRRSNRTYAHATFFAFATLFLTGLLTTCTVTGLVIGVQPWYQPQYLIPLLGMVLGNGLTGISLCLDTLLESLSERRHEVEMELSCGATRWEAARPPLAHAVRKGMIPVINAMMVVGVVSLPGMMTGQILAGADPSEAARYQIVVMFMIAGATSLGCISIGVLTCLRMFSDRHQLRSDRIVRREG